jgi:hypothetical protein
MPFDTSWETCEQIRKERPDITPERALEAIDELLKRELHYGYLTSSEQEFYVARTFFWGLFLPSVVPYGQHLPYETP